MHVRTYNRASVNSAFKWMRTQGLYAIGILRCRNWRAISSISRCSQCRNCASRKQGGDPKVLEHQTISRCLFASRRRDRCQRCRNRAIPCTGTFFAAAGTPSTGTQTLCDSARLRSRSVAAITSSMTISATLYSLPPVPCSPTNQPNLR